MSSQPDSTDLTVTADMVANVIAIHTAVGDVVEDGQTLLVDGGISTGATKATVEKE